MMRGHYMDRGGQVPHVMQHNALVCMWRVSVSDSGPGVDQAKCTSRMVVRHFENCAILILALAMVIHFKDHTGRFLYRLISNVAFSVPKLGSNNVAL
jgi:hypothetical protein